MLCEHCGKPLPQAAAPTCCTPARFDYADGHFRETGECPFCLEGDCDYCRATRDEQTDDGRVPIELDDCGPNWTPLEY